MSLKNIEHVVVLMMENRSLDNMLGWLYADGPPAANIPASLPPFYDGLKPRAYSNSLAAPGSPPVFASHPPKARPPLCPLPTQAPTPDPHEEFLFVTQQLFGADVPVPGTTPAMGGFLQNYSTTSAGVAAADQIMEGYGPEQAGVIHALARNFAVCDRWFASVPTQTWPNRGFVHSASSDGHINNEDYEPYRNRTIFNALSDQGKSWGVFHDTLYVPSLTHVQFRQLWRKDECFHRWGEFKRRASAGAGAAPGRKLPAYSFIEPRFVPEPGDLFHLFRTQYPSDYHPPHDIIRGERFLAEVYNAVRASPYRDRILLIITFDEHGGCYDHVPPPWGSLPPEAEATPARNGFAFDRYGVRVPTILVSSYVAPGTVFRAPPDSPPFDHTSILATVRDWQGLGRNPELFLPSPRINTAPTLDPILTLGEEQRRLNWPSISAKWRFGKSTDVGEEIPLSDLQKSLLAHTLRQDSPMDLPMARHARRAKAQFQHYRHALDYLKAHRRRRH